MDSARRKRREALLSPVVERGISDRLSKYGLNMRLQPTKATRFHTSGTETRSAFVGRGSDTSMKEKARSDTPIYKEGKAFLLVEGVAITQQNLQAAPGGA